MMRRSKSRKFKRAKCNPFVFNLIALCLVSIFTIFYLVQSNEVASSSFKIKKLEERVEHLRGTNEMLELETASLKSLSFLKQESEILGMVRAESPEFVISIGSAVAVK